MKQRGQRIEQLCPTCKGSLKKGLLWLCGKDYVECPDCGGPSGGHPGVFIMYEETIMPPTVFAVDGLKGKVVVSGFTHSPSKQVAVPKKIKE